MVPIVVSIIVPLLLYFLNKASKKSVTAASNGSYELRMNIMYLVIGVAGAIIGFLFLLLPILSDEYSIEIFIIAGIMFLLSMGFAIPCFLWYRNHRLSFDDIRLIAGNAYGKIQQVNWEDVSQVRFSSFMGVVYIIDKQGNTVKVHQHLIGFASFIKMLQTKRNEYKFVSESLPLKMLGLK